MTTETSIEAYPSAGAMRVVHAELLERRRVEGLTPELTRSVTEFVARGQATGALLDTDEERWSSQSLLDYWANALYRAGQDTPEPTLAAFDITLAPDLGDDECPYRGLDAFQETDQTYFFGRPRMIEQLVERVEARRLVVVLGASGSGKSSLVLAGLVPALKNGAVAGSQDWHVYGPLVPGSNPLASLVRAMPEPPDPRTTALVVVDQFEEIFTLCGDDAVRTEFVDRLLDLAELPDARHTVVLTMRRDFEPDVYRVPRLNDRFAEAAVLVQMPDAAELRDMIEQPAQLVGLKFEDGIVGELVGAFLDEPAGLPLLQFTLLKLWEAREHNRVTWSAYRRVCGGRPGGGRLVLAHSADLLYDQLIPEEQVTARRILLRLVRPAGEGLEFTSSRIRRAALFAGGEARDRVERVLDRLVTGRLLRLTCGDTPDDDQVEVAHEALVRNWPTLREWLAEDRAALAMRRRLEHLSEEWERLDRHAGLLDEVQLKEAEAWLASEQAAYLGFSPSLPDLVKASQDKIEADKAEREAIHVREIAQAQALVNAQRGRARWLVFSVVLLSALLAGAISAGVWAFEHGQEAEAQAQHAQEQAQQQVGLAYSQLITTQGFLPMATRPDLGLLLMVTAQQHINSPQTSLNLLQALQQTGRLQTYVRGTDTVGGAQTIDFTRDGKTLAIGTRQGLRLVDTTSPTGAPVAARLISPDAAQAIAKAVDVRAVAFSPDDDTLAFAGADGVAIVHATGDDDWSAAKVTSVPRMRVGALAFSPRGDSLITMSRSLETWDAASGSPKAQHTLPGFDSSSSSSSLAVSPDGQLIATSGPRGSLVVWDSSDPTQPIELPDANASASANMAFTPDGRTLVFVDTSGGIARWDVAGQRRQPIHTDSFAVRTLAISPDGSTVVAGGTNGEIRMWDMVSGDPKGAPLVGHAGQVTAVVFGPRGKSLASVSADGTTILWQLQGLGVGSRVSGANEAAWGVAYDAANGSLEGGLSPSSSFTADGLSTFLGAYSPDGQFDATTSDSTTLQVHRASTGELVGPEHALDGAVSLLAVSPNGEMVASDQKGAPGVIVVRDVLKTDEPRTLHTLPTSSTPTTATPPRVADLTALAFSPSGTLLVSGSADGVLRFWDPVAGNLLYTTPPRATPPGHVYSLAFNSDGTVLVSGHEDRSIYVWSVSDPANPRQTGPGGLGAGSADVESLAVSPDGLKLAWGTRNGSISLWDLGRGASSEPLATFTGQTGPIKALVFSPDGSHLASASAADGIVEWDATPALWVTRACAKVGRNLRADELAQYVAPLGLSFLSKCPDIPFDARELLSVADTTARAGKASEAHDWYLLAVNVATSPDAGPVDNGTQDKRVVARTDNSICWRGSIDGFASTVMPACEQAVLLASNSGVQDEIAGYRDSRGLARALAGQYGDAISDFQAFIDWATSPDSSNSRFAHDATVSNERRDWIKTLNEQRNPFTPEVLDHLRSE